MTQLITMSTKELSRYDVIKKLVIKEINGTEAANQLGLSTRQVRRLKDKVKKRGIKGLIHGNRGQPGNHLMAAEKAAKLKKIISEQYRDFGPTFAAEKLKENHQLEISDEKLRQLMTAWGFWRPKPRKKNKEYRSWRLRKEHYGEMIQFDGSYHDWFEGRAPECCLLGAIDDATGKITGLKFTANEGVIPVFIFWRQYVRDQGKPLNIYLDKYSTYKVNAKRLLDDPAVLTQFERAIKDLDTKIIHAQSPQAKGRVERLFGTLQDRLVKELRLAKISALKEANVFLDKAFSPQFNHKFGVLPQKKANFHKKLTKIEQKNLEKVFSIQDQRTVNNDFTVRYKTRWFQLGQSQPALVLRKDRVLIEERIDGSIFISLRDKYLNFQELPKRPQKLEKMKVTALTRSKPRWKPPLNHPWRQPFIVNQPKVEQPIKTNQVGHF